MNKLVGIFITILGVVIAAAATTVAMLWWTTSDVVRKIKNR